ncbi:PspC domain-containing protein [Ruania halotolerans]|uniref:PspC domain-containing protein n=1 Tax=Ruania halotolerans TaxID=2897773 RepID=UPI001E49851B|nr:PspC domain-containing protein [Ruania halotolerans]UFU05662.1 PspC domain-containing protein [Ruania halotolerans]
MNSNASDPKAPAADGFFDSLRRANLPRTQDRWIGGVAAGLAHRLGIDPLIVRGAFLLITLFGGFGLLVYGVAWALLPEHSDGRIHLQEAIRGRFDAALAGALLLTVIGLSRAGFWWSGWGALPVSLGIIALIALVAVIALAIQRRQDEGSIPGTAETGPAAPGGYSGQHDPGGQYGPGGHSQHYGSEGSPWPGGPAGPAGPWGAGSTPPPDPPAGTAETTVAFAAGPTGTIVAPSHASGEEAANAPGTTGTSSSDGQDERENTETAAVNESKPSEPSGPNEPSEPSELSERGERDGFAGPSEPVEHGAPAGPTEPIDTPAPEETHVLPATAAAHGDWSHMSTTSTPADHTPWSGAASNAPPVDAEQPPTVPPPGQPPVPPSDHLPEPPPAPAPPPKPRVPGPGATLVRVTLGLILLVVAVLLYAGYTGSGTMWTQPWFADPGTPNTWSTPVVALGAAVALFGLGAVIAGLMGRRSGSLGVLGTLVALVAIPWAMVHSTEVVHRFDWNDSSAYGEQRWQPATAAEATEGYDQLAGGVLIVDLSDLEDVTVPGPVEVELGAGELTVLVPEGLPIVIDTSVTGEVVTRNLNDWTAQVEGRAAQTIDGDIDYGFRFGGNREVTISSPEANDATVEALELHVDLGFGEIVIEER